MKRIFLFLATNIAVLVVISIILSLLGLSGNPNDMGGLLAFSAVIGFSGSIISLMTSKMIAKQRSRSVAGTNCTKPSQAMEYKNA